MKQFIYTACPTGKRADDRRATAGGFGMRALTPGLTSIGLDLLSRAASCKFPGPKFHPAEPIERLALLDLKDGVRILLHTLVGKNDEFDRNRIPFTHALVGPSKAFEAPRAIRTWSSPDWLGVYDADELDLLECEEPKPGPLDPAALRAFLAVEHHRVMTAFALSALTEPQPPEKVFLYAEPGAVARVVYALTLALPRAMALGLTFSTYEKSPIDVQARIIGSWGNEIEDDLPRLCYQGPRFAGFHLGKGGRPSYASTYADAAVNWLANGQSEQLANFLEEAEELQAATKSLLLPDLITLRERPGELTLEQVRRLLTNAAAVAMLAREPASRKRMIEAAVVENGGTEFFDHLVNVSAKVAGVRGLLAEQVVTMALSAAEEGRHQELIGLHGLLKRDYPTQHHGFGELALSRLGSATLSWDVRRVLLSLLPKTAARPDPWLDAPSDRFADLLDLHLPLPWEALAWARLAEHGGLANPSLASRLAKQPPKQVVAVARCLSGAKADQWLLPVFQATDAVALLEAFEGDGLGVPDAVADHVLAEKGPTQRKLSSFPILARLKKLREQQPIVIDWALDGQWHHSLLARPVREGLTDSRLAKLFGDAGWRALEEGRVEHARRAFEEGLSKLGDGCFLLEFENRLPREMPKGYPAKSEQYLIGRGTPVTKERIRSWMCGLTPETLQWIVDGKAQSNDVIQSEAFCYFYKATNQLPDTRSFRVSVAGLVVVLAWLIKSEREADAVDLFGRLLIEQPEREVELREVVFRPAPDQPDFWPLADYYLSRWIAVHPENLGAGVDRFALPILASRGCTEAVVRMVRGFLDRDDPLSVEAEQLLVEVIRAPDPRFKGLPPPTGLVEEIRFRLGCDSKGGMATLADLVSYLGSFLGGKRERAQRQLIRRLCDRLLEPQTWSNQLRAELNEQVEALADSKAGFAGKIDILQRVLEMLVTPDRKQDFVSNPQAVAAFFWVAIREGEPARMLGESLARTTWESNNETFFLRLARHTHDWTDKEYAAWERFYQKAKEPPSPPPAKAGWFSNWSGAGKR